MGLGQCSNSQDERLRPNALLLGFFLPQMNGAGWGGGVAGSWVGQAPCRFSWLGALLPTDTACLPAGPSLSSHGGLRIVCFAYLKHALEIQN